MNHSMRHSLTLEDREQPNPDSDLAIENELATAKLSEIVGLYHLKMPLFRRRPDGRYGRLLVRLGGFGA
jgi:hypothetical protein